MLTTCPPTTIVASGWYCRTRRHEQVEKVVTLVPPNWWLLNWVAESRDRLVEDSDFGQAARSVRPNELSAYLRRYPEGRYVREARALLAERGE